MSYVGVGSALGQVCPECSFWSGTACLPCPTGSMMPECEDCAGGRPIPEKVGFIREYGPQIAFAVVTAAAVALAVPALLGALGRSE